jgi:hypothetical protein
MRSPTMLAAFAEHYCLRLKRDSCGEPIIHGKFGHLYEHASGLLGLVLEESRIGKSKCRTLLGSRSPGIPTYSWLSIPLTSHPCVVSVTA